jgi:transcriptional regulator GlxA family with amidase domain
MRIMSSTRSDQPKMAPTLERGERSVANTDLFVHLAAPPRSAMPARAFSVLAPTGGRPPHRRTSVLSPPIARIRGGLPPKALGRVREYIDAHLHERITIDSLADLVGLSMFHFVRAFKQSEGTTPHNYVIQRRVKRAMELLASTDLPLSEIALAAGFSDQSHCGRRFREHVGVRPRDYRWSTR